MTVEVETLKHSRDYLADEQRVWSADGPAEVESEAR